MGTHTHTNTHVPDPIMPVCNPPMPSRQTHEIGAITLRHHLLKGHLQRDMHARDYENARCLNGQTFMQEPWVCYQLHSNIAMRMSTFRNKIFQLTELVYAASKRRPDVMTCVEKPASDMESTPVSQHTSLITRQTPKVNIKSQAHQNYKTTHKL